MILKEVPKFLVVIELFDNKTARKFFSDIKTALRTLQVFKSHELFACKRARTYLQLRTHSKKLLIINHTSLKGNQGFIIGAKTEDKILTGFLYSKLN